MWEKTGENSENVKEKTKVAEVKQKGKIEKAKEPNRLCKEL